MQRDTHKKRSLIEVPLLGDALTLQIPMKRSGHQLNRTSHPGCIVAKDIVRSG